MPRSISTDLQNHYNQEILTLTSCVKITRKDGVVLGFTTLDSAFTYLGILYSPLESVTPSALKQSSTTGVDNLEITGILSSDRITDQDLRDGFYDQAEVLMFQVNYNDLSMGALVTFKGTIGEVTLSNNGYKAELFSLTTNLKQQIGDTMSPGCTVKRLFDPQCKKDPTGFRVSGNLAAINTPGTNPIVSVGISTIYQINCGGGSASSYVADTKFHGGRADGASGTVDTSSVANPAPNTVYQTQRNQVFYYLLDSLVPLKGYTLRLHFAELHWDSSGKRTFQVNINGVTALYNYDVYARAGGKRIAITETFENITSDNLGRIRVDFLSGLDIPMVAAIELSIPASPGGSNTETQYVVSSINKPTGYFDYGIMYCVIDGVSQEYEIKQSISSGTNMLIQLRQAPHRVFPIGTNMTLEAGCDRAWSTCKYKFNNSINFHGFPHLPGTSKLVHQGRASG